MQMTRIRCTDMRPDPRSRGYQHHEVEALAESIRRYGVLRPVLLRQTTGGYLIVHGERRWHAARLAGLAAIPAVLVTDLARDENWAAGSAAFGLGAAVSEAALALAED